MACTERNNESAERKAVPLNNWLSKRERRWRETEKREREHDVYIRAAFCEYQKENRITIDDGRGIFFVLVVSGLEQRRLWTITWCIADDDVTPKGSFEIEVLRLQPPLCQDNLFPEPCFIDPSFALKLSNCRRSYVKTWISSFTK